MRIQKAKMSIYSEILLKADQNRKQFAVLIDPDRITTKDIEKIAQQSAHTGVDLFFVGGSLLIHDNLDKCVKVLKANTDVPVVLFPGNTMQINFHADALLFLSLISGRNSDFLIGQHVIAAPVLKQSSLEIISCGYMLIESGKHTAVHYMSNTNPIPRDKTDIAVCTAMAGEMLGFKMLYLEAGSGAQQSVPVEMIKQVKQNTAIPIITGGGIRTPENAKEAAHAGADIIVVGTALEHNSGLTVEMAKAVHETGQN